MTALLLHSPEQVPQCYTDHLSTLQAGKTFKFLEDLEVGLRESNRAHLHVVFLRAQFSRLLLVRVLRENSVACVCQTEICSQSPENITLVRLSRMSLLLLPR